MLLITYQIMYIFLVLYMHHLRELSFVLIFIKSLHDSNEQWRMSSSYFL